MTDLELKDKEIAELKEALQSKITELESVTAKLETTIKKVDDLEKEKEELANEASEQIKSLKAKNSGSEIIREPLAFKHNKKVYKFNFLKFSIGNDHYDAEQIVKNPESFKEQIQKAIDFGGFIEEIKSEGK